MLLAGQPADSGTNIEPIADISASRKATETSDHFIEGRNSGATLKPT
jgi:hypothetical protein